MTDKGEISHMKSSNEIIKSDYLGENLKFDISARQSNTYDIQVSRLGKTYVFNDFYLPSDLAKSDDDLIAQFLDYLNEEYSVAMNYSSFEAFRDNFGHQMSEDTYDTIKRNVELMTSFFTPDEIESWRLED